MANITEIVFLLDRSGSMHGMEKDTIGGFNSMLEEQKNGEGTAFISTILFDDRQEVLHDRLPIGEVLPLAEKDYTVRGSTALLDAIGGAIHHIANIHKYARKEDVPQKTLFVITTDGYENASRRYTLSRVREMIEREKERYGWEFIFLGANIDAIHTAASFGIAPDRAANFHNDSIGAHLNYAGISRAVSDLRASRPLSQSWRKDIDNDYRTRG